MDDIYSLYQELILDHSKHPRHFGVLDSANHHAEGHNPLCGDQLTVMLQCLDDGTIEQIQFTGSGCAISMASASLMTDIVKGKSLSEVSALFNQFHAVMTGKTEYTDENKLNALAGVKQFPMRVKCATLAWHTLQAALKDNPSTITTE